MFAKFLENLRKDPVTMIDLETLDVAPSAVVLSIGAAVYDFRSQIITRELYCTLRIEEQLAQGRTVSTNTLHWWLDMTDEARGALTKPESLERQSKESDVYSSKAVSYASALSILKHFIPEKGFIIAKPSTFDLAILNDMAKGDLFHYRRAFDMSTMLAMLDPDRESCPPNALAHNAIQDVKWQTEWFANVIKKIDHLA